jgi:hypothetical protein
MLTDSELAKLDVSLQCSGLGIVLTSSQLSDLSRMQVRLHNNYILQCQHHHTCSIFATKHRMHLLSHTSLCGV